jgi:4-amino-4-deoxy-L-arabinose transferase-like glycosyltransferase
MNKKLILAMTIFLQAAILVAMLLMSKVKYENFVLTDEEGSAMFVEFPYSAKSLKESGGDTTYTIYKYELKGKIHLNILSPRYYKIIPDDQILSLTINEKEVSLDSIPESKKRDYRNGFAINLSKYLQNGENSIEIKFEDSGGLMGIKMQPLVKGIGNIVFYLLSFSFLISILFIFPKKIFLPKRYSFILFIAIVMRIVYLSATDFDTRAHDTYAHLEYIQHFVKNWSLPNVDQAKGSAFFHPPLYYFSSALIYSGISLLTDNNTGYIYFSLQIFSLLASIGFVFFGIQETRLIFAYFIKKDSLLLQKILPWICCLLIALWPSGILHSVRIGNDPLFYFLFAAASYSWTSLYLRGKSKYLLMATFFTAFAILTKVNAIFLLPVVIILFLSKAIAGKFSFSKENLKGGLLASLAIMIALGFATYPGIKLKFSGERETFYVSNINNVSSALRVRNNLENILWLDVKTFVNKPFTSPWEDEYGRQHFPNYLGKTALFGEWQYKGIVLHNIAVAISIIALLMVAISIISLFKMPLNNIGILLPVLCTSLFLLCGITYMRVTFPVNIDFRYILPIIVPFSIFYNYGINLSLSEGKQRFAVFAIFLELLFCLLSFWFILQLCLRGNR